MRDDDIFSVLLVCSDQDRSWDILSRLYEDGFDVIGPAARGASALALAAQSGPTVALVTSSLTGRRQATEVADDLMRNWGVPSFILDDAIDDTTGWPAVLRDAAAARRGNDTPPALA